MEQIGEKIIKLQDIPSVKNPIKKASSTLEAFLLVRCVLLTPQPLLPNCLSNLWSTAPQQFFLHFTGGVASRFLRCGLRVAATAKQAFQLSYLAL